MGNRFECKPTLSPFCQFNQVYCCAGTVNTKSHKTYRQHRGCSTANTKCVITQFRQFRRGDKIQKLRRRLQCGLTWVKAGMDEGGMLCCALCPGWLLHDCQLFMLM